MAQITNLNRVRKQKARAAKQAKGNANAARFGRSKAQRELDQTRADKAQRDWSGHERE